MPWRSRPFTRAIFIASYFLFMVSGVFAFFFPAQVITSALQGTAVYVWASFLTTGGGMSLYSPLRNNWRGELVGLPLLSAANAIFGTALIGYGTTNAASAVGLAFWALGLLLLGHWVELRGKTRIARRVGNGNT